MQYDEHNDNSSNTDILEPFFSAMQEDTELNELRRSQEEREAGNHSPPSRSCRFCLSPSSSQVITTMVKCDILDNKPRILYHQHIEHGWGCTTTGLAPLFLPQPSELEIRYAINHGLMVLRNRSRQDVIRIWEGVTRTGMVQQGLARSNMD